MATEKPDIFALAGQIDIADYLGLEDTGARSRRYPCPFPSCKSKKSLQITEKDGKRRFKTYCCGKSGDAIDYELYLAGVKDNPTPQERLDAARRVCQKAGHHIDDTGAPGPAPKITPKPKAPIQAPTSNFPTLSELRIKAASLDDCRRWCSARGFGKHADAGAETLHRAALGMSTRPYTSREPVIVVPVQNGDAVVTAQMLGYPNGDGTWKRFCKGEPGKPGIGYLTLHPTKPEMPDKMVIVESVANGLALAAIGIPATVIFSTSNIPLTGTIQAACPKADVMLWLDRGVEDLQRDACAKYGVAGIYFDESRPKGYDINDLLRESPQDFYSNVIGHLGRAEQPSKHRKIWDIADGIAQDTRQFNVVIASTGTGKTKAIIDAMQKSDDCLLLTDSKQNAENAKALVPGAVLVVSEGVEKHDRLAPETSTGKTISTYGYTGFNGHKPGVYALAGYSQIDLQKGSIKDMPGLFDASDIFCDEIHALVERCRESYPLCQGYALDKVDGGHHWRPVQSWEGLKRYGYNYTPRRVKNSHNRFRYVDYDENNTDKTFENVKVSGLQSPTGYSQIHNTLFAMELQPTITPAIPGACKEQEPHTELEYLSELRKKLFNPQIQTHFPVLKETGKPLAQHELNALLQAETDRFSGDTSKARESVNKLVMFPSQMPYVPHLTGYNLLPLLQIMRKAQHVTGFTGTLLPMYGDVLEQAAAIAGWKINFYEYAIVPFRYDVDVLLYPEALSNTEASKILLSYNIHGLPGSLTVTHKQHQASTIWKNVRHKAGKDFAYYCHSDYIHNEMDTHASQQVNTSKHVISYMGAAALQGGNDFASHQFMVIDAGLFIPLLALDLMPGDNTREKRDEKTGQLFTQYAGRLFRPWPKEWEAWNNTPLSDRQTTTSAKKIVMVIHNASGIDLKLDQAIANVTYHRDSGAGKRWFSRIPELLPQSIVDAVQKCLTGQEPDNYAEIDAQWLQDKGLAQRHLTQKKRDELGPELDRAKQDKAAAKFAEKVKEIKRLQAAGMSKRDLMIKFNTTKYPEIKTAIDAIFQS